MFHWSCEWDRSSEADATVKSAINGDNQFVIWGSLLCSRFTEDQPSFSDLRREILSTPGEEPRLCYTVYPESIDKDFDEEEVGKPLYLTPMIKEGRTNERYNEVLTLKSIKAVCLYFFLWVCNKWSGMINLQVDTQMPLMLPRCRMWCKAREVIPGS